MNKKILFIIVMLWIILSWSIIWLNIYNNSITINKEWCSISEDNVSCATEDTTSIVTTWDIINGNFKNKTQLYGKPTFLRRAGKFCAYCRDKLPEVEKLIFEPYKDKINIQIMTMNIETAPFDTSIPQAPFDTLNFKDFAWESCDTFPTWVVLDTQWDLVNVECGWKTTIQEVADEIKNLL